MKVKSESEVVQSCPTLRDPMDCSLPGSSIPGIFQARVLERVATAFSEYHVYATFNMGGILSPSYSCTQHFVFYHKDVSSIYVVKCSENGSKISLEQRKTSKTIAEWREYEVLMRNSSIRMSIAVY